MRKLILVAVAATAIAGFAGCSSSHTGTPTPSSGVSKGLGSTDASKDVTLGKASTDTGITTLSVGIVNHSSKRSTYFVTVALESADHKTQLDTGIGTASNVDPGQSAQASVMFTATNIPPTAVFVLKSVQRTASN